MKKNTIKMKSEGEFVSAKRMVCGVDGLLKGTTKVQGRKGKKAYNRNNKSWKKDC